MIGGRIDCPECKGRVTLGRCAVCNPVATTATKSQEVSIHDLKRTVSTLKASRHSQLLATLEGIKVMPDHTGMLCGENDYMVIMGGKLWDELQALATIKDKK